MKHFLKYQNKGLKHIIITDLISGLLLLLFLYTSLSKFADHETFKNVLLASPLLSPLADLIAWVLPFIEIVIVVLLFIPAFRLKGLYASLITILLFTLYLIYMILFTPNLPCSCGGVVQLLTWPQHIVFNLFFIFLSVIGILFYRRAKNLKSSAPP